MAEQPEDREMTLVEIVLYADEKAFEATWDMPRDGKRVAAFARAWDKAFGECIKKTRRK